MPPFANPNPNRAVRPRAPAAAAATAPPQPLVTQPLVAQPLVVQPPVAQPPVAQPLVAAQPLATPAATVARAGGFGTAPVRKTGLMLQHDPDARKRTSSAARTDPAWACVEIIDKPEAHQPRWRCFGAQCCTSWREGWGGGAAGEAGGGEQGAAGGAGRGAGS